MQHFRMHILAERLQEVWQLRAVRWLAAAFFVAALAQIRVPLPFTPVPVTGQTLGVLLVGAALNPADAGLAMWLYALLGGAGLPMFAGWGAGWSHIFGPTGGYILGFIPAAWTVSLLLRMEVIRLPWRVWVALVIGNALIYLFGLPWLAAFVGMQKVLALGFLPFLPGDGFKLILAGMLIFHWEERRSRR